MKRIIPILSLCLFLMHCNPEEPPEDCVISECNNFAYGIVHSETDENLVGYNRMFNPDDVSITDEDLNPLTFKTRYKDWVDWWEFSFNYHELLQRCDLHTTDSTYSLRVLIHLTDSDTDTLDFRIAPCRDFDDMFYNGNNHVIPPTEPVGEKGLNPNSLSTFFLRKKMAV